MKAVGKTFLVGLFTFLVLINDAFGASFVTILSVKGEVKASKNGHEWALVKEGEEIDSFIALKLHDKAYAKIILKDNSIIHIGERSYLSLSHKKSKTKISLGRGRMRVLSYKGEKVIKTPQRTFSLYKGEYLIDVFKKNSLMQMNLTAYSGHLFFNDEVVMPEKYIARPEVRNSKNSTIDLPNSYWFPKRIKGASYDIAIAVPKKKKKASRSIASITVEEELAPKEDLYIEEERGEIWVHDIVYDEAVRVIESLVHKEVQKLVPPAVAEASKNLVWDVAGRSIKRWGVYHAREGEKMQVPLAVNNAYQNEVVTEKRSDYTPENVASFEYSTSKVAKIRTYRASKVLVETKGYESAWRETRDYIEDLLPDIVTPLVVKDVYKKVIPLAQKAVDEAMDKSDLVYSRDVDKLIRHVTLLTTEKFTDKAVEKYGEIHATKEAKLAVGELAKGVSHDIATYMAEKASKRAASLIATLFARKRARGIASTVAKESNEEIYQNMRRQERRKIFRTHR